MPPTHFNLSHRAAELDLTIEIEIAIANDLSDTRIVVLDQDKQRAEFDTIAAAHEWIDGYRRGAARANLRACNDRSPTC